MAKIAIVDLCFNWPPLGGSWVDIKNIAQRLQARGHEPVLFVPLLDYGFARGRIDTPMPFAVRRIPFSRYSYNLLAAPLRFRREIRMFDPDFVFIADGYFLKPFLVHALREYRPIVRFYAYEIFCIQNNRFKDGVNCRSNLLGAGRARCLDCRRKNYPITPGIIKLLRNEPQYFVFHEFLMSLAFLPLYPYLFRRFLSEAGRIIVYNSVQKELLREYNPNISIAPSGIDTNLFSPRAGKPTGPFTIGLAGRFYEEGKGLKLAIEACRRLRSEGWEFQVLVASPEEIELRDEFIRYCGWFNRENLADFYAGCNVIIVPSIWEEPFGITALEAMACGVPVVASSSGALPEIVKNGKIGSIFPCGDAGALADRLRDLIEDPGMADRMGTAARERAVTEYDWSKIMDRVYFPLFENTDKHYE